MIQKSPSPPQFWGIIESVRTGTSGTDTRIGVHLWKPRQVLGSRYSRPRWQGCRAGDSTSKCFRVKLN